MPDQGPDLSATQTQMLAALGRLGAHDPSMPVSTTRVAREAGTAVIVAARALHVLYRLGLAGWKTVHGGGSDYWLTTTGLDLARNGRITEQETAHG
jgi:hypothetical protein